MFDSLTDLQSSQTKRVAFPCADCLIPLLIYKALKRGFERQNGGNVWFPYWFTKLSNWYAAGIQAVYSLIPLLIYKALKRTEYKNHLLYCLIPLLIYKALKPLQVPATELSGLIPLLIYKALKRCPDI